MEVYRITKTKYASDLTGFGAEKFGGRWNSKGFALIYTSQSKALAMVEVAVHLAYNLMPNDFSLVCLEIPDTEAIDELNLKKLPTDWNNIPHTNGTQILGDEFILKNAYVCIKAPSVLVKGEYNYLLNPQHKSFSKIQIKYIEAFSFDKRLIR